jgi:hypothetical protein
MSAHLGAANIKLAIASFKSRGQFLYKDPKQERYFNLCFGQPLHPEKIIQLDCIINKKS